MSDNYFLVTRYPNEQNPTDIAFSPINTQLIPKEYLDFKTDIEQFIGVINLLFKSDQAQRKNYYEKAFYAAQICFSGLNDDFEVAERTLNDIKVELLNNSWIKIRNRILTRYGIVSAIGIAIFGMAAMWLAEDLKNIPVILAGTCFGFWVSINIKTGNIGFSEIQASINDVQSPILRITFCCALSLLFSLLLNSGFVEVNLGKISSASIETNKWIAFCVGSLLGFSEKAISAKLTQKSAELIAKD